MADRSDDPGADAQDRIAHQVRRLQQLLRRTGDAALQTTGLTLAQYTVLRAIAHAPDRSSAQIARDCHVSRQSLQDLMRILRGNGYVRVVEPPGHGRVLPIRITPEGRKVLRRAERAIGRVEDRMIDGISAEEVAQVTRLLNRCAQNIEGG